jgi:hypothetical protein
MVAEKLSIQTLQTHWPTPFFNNQATKQPSNQVTKAAFSGFVPWLLCCSICRRSQHPKHG